MRRIKWSDSGKFFLGGMVALLVFGGPAIALNDYVSDNTPENGYLLCANKKTKAVTFPNKLSCPSGTTALDLGAVTGVEGPEGPMGPQGYSGPQGPAGPAGSSTKLTNFYRITNGIDIVADGSSYTTWDSLRKVIVSTIKPGDLPIGTLYLLDAKVEGLWADNVPDGRLFGCNFQSKSDYDAGKTSRQYGRDTTENGSWTGIYLTVSGYFYNLSASSDPVHLVCATGGTVKGIVASIEAQAMDGGSQEMKNS
jgi:hypothetical protein